MNNKLTMLITGASSGIGLACYNLFKEKYNVVTSHRSVGADFRGDLTDLSFREELCRNVTPDIFINNAGGMCEGDTVKILELNAVAQVDLLMKFYNKMKPGGVIINIASICAELRGWQGMEETLIPYIAAKHAIKAASLCYTDARFKDIRVSCVEPDMVAGTRTSPHLIDEGHYNDFSADQYTPMRPKDIATLIEHELTQPRWMVKGLIQVSLASRHLVMHEPG